MKFSNYSQVRSYLENFIKPVVFERITKEQARIRDPLARMRYFLSLLGDPQNQFQSVLVGGTAGKGSTAYLISHILKTQGYKTGLTISPHLQKINERIQINGQPISDKNLISIVSSIVDTIELMKKSDFGEPSYFEILVALAFQRFAKEKVDIAVVEVGLGGRYDATNTLTPLISVLTNVSLDHTQILGKTVEQIAREKVGIIKDHSSLRSLRQFSRSAGSAKASRELMQNLVVITGVKQPSVVKIVEDKCKEVGGELYRLGKDFSFEIKKEDINGSVFDFKNKNQNITGLRLSLQGAYQAENASIAIETILKLKNYGFNVQKEDIRKALKTAFFPGRFEIIQIDSSLRLASLAQDKMSSTLILDGAHNPTKMKAFIKALKKFRGSTSQVAAQKLIFVVAFKNDKDIKGMLKQILSVADFVIVTEFHVTTDVSKNAAMPIKNLKSNKNIKTYFKRDSKKALEKAFKISGPNDLIVITGSLYLVGEIRNLFNPPIGSGSYRITIRSRLSQQRRHH